jgi:hypothetical protein
MIKPQVAKRLEQCVGQDFDSRECRVTNPHITARESIALADYIAAVEAERDELAAQVEQLQKLMTVWHDQSERDAEVAAKAVDECIDIAHSKFSTTGITGALQDYANQLRQAAKEKHQC